MTRPLNLHEVLEASRLNLEGLLEDFTASNEGRSVSPDGLVLAQVRINGECQIRLRPSDLDTDESERQIRLTYNSAVRRMSRALSQSEPVSRFGRGET